MRCSWRSKPWSWSTRSAPFSAAEVTAGAMAGFRELFGTSMGAGTLPVAEHVVGIEKRDIIVASSVALGEELIGGIG